MRRRLLTAFISVGLIVVLLASCLLVYGCKKKTEEEWQKDYVTYGYVDDGAADISIGVLADVHVMAETQAVDMTCPDYKSWEAHGQKMLGLSESILKTAVDRIIAESDFKVVLVSGDNSDDGGETSHRVVAAELKRLENAGIKVYTIPGNHDLNNKSCTYAGGKATYTNPTTEVEFASIYADFGYNTTDSLEFYKRADASSAERKTASFSIGDNLSYVADLPGDYRLIAIDMCNYVANDYLRDTDGSYAAAGYEVDSEGYVLVEGERFPFVSGYLWDEDGSYAAAGYRVNEQGYVLDEDGDRISVPGRHDGAMTQSLLLWAKSKIEEAKRAGKTPIGMMHFPLLQHFGPLVNAANGAVNDPEGYVVAEVLADAGMNYIFTGHIHMQDDNIYTSAKGNKILDINSASLCNFPTPVRYFRAKGDDVYVRTWNMDRIEEKYLPAYLTAEEKAKIKSDFRDYSVDYIDGSMFAKVMNKIDIDLVYKLLKKFGIEKKGANAAAVTDLATSIFNDVILKFLNMPLYKKDAGSGQSVESIANSYGIELPSSKYSSVFDLAMSYVVGVYGGDENASANEPRAALLKYSIYSAFRLISDFDLFGKMHRSNAAIPTISLSATVDTLYGTGTFDICGNGLLIGVLSALNISALKKLNINSASDPYETLASVVKIVKDTGLANKYGIDINKYVVADKISKYGFIRLGTILDGDLYGKLTLGLMNDAIKGQSTYAYLGGKADTAVPDNNLRINTKTMAYIALQ